METQEGEIAGLTEDRRWNWDRTPGLCEPHISSLFLSHLMEPGEGNGALME